MGEGETQTLKNQLEAAKDTRAELQADYDLAKKHAGVFIPTVHGHGSSISLAQASKKA